MSRFSIAILGLLALSASLARADEEIVIRTPKGLTKVKGIIQSDTPQGLVLKSGQKIPADEIEDVAYDLSSSFQAALSYRNAFNSEREWMTNPDPKKRAAAYADALDKYTKAFQAVTDPKVKAHIEFRIGYIRGKKAQEDGSSPQMAITSLNSFMKSNPNSWPITRVVLLLAALQNEAKDYQGAEQTYAELLRLDVPEDVKNDARLQGALASVYLGKHAVAEAKLAELLKTLPKGSRAYARALVGQAECLFAANKSEEAIDLLKKAIKESDDKSLRAVAYNTLGSTFYKADQMKEARWEFLWVEMVYNQDRNELARALYHLSHIFDRLAEPEKAAQCRANLLDGAFTGTEWQRKLQKEQGK